ncbi:MAG: hypothetical protein RLP15_05345 [Cryomorphaceae bacterium]
MRILLLTALIFIVQPLRSQDDHQRIFDQLSNDGKWESIPNVLTSWESSSPTDAQLFVAKFNYYFHESRKEVVQMVTEEPEGEYLVVKDTATGEPVGYMHSTLAYDDSIFNLAIEAINEGLKFHPKRLDMHFGKIYVLRERGQVDAHIDAIVKVIHRHEKYHDQWLWANDEPVDDIDAMFTGSMQDYCYALFNMPEPRLDGVSRISSLLTQLYPSDVRFYSNLGACSLMTQDFPSALQYFLTANEKQKNDPVVLSNIAYTYLLLNQPESAKIYYQQLESIGDEQEALFAREQLLRIESGDWRVQPSE